MKKIQKDIQLQAVRLTRIVHDIDKGKVTERSVVTRVAKVLGDLGKSLGDYLERVNTDISHSNG